MRATLFAVTGLALAATAMAAPAVKWGNLPLSFEPNLGQAAAEVRYLARGSSYTLDLDCAETVLEGRSGQALRTKLAGANGCARVAGIDLQASTSNYFRGSD